MALPNRSPHYRSYLLRLWHEPAPDASGGTWRFMLEDPHTGERRGFADFQNLIGHLNQVMNQTDAHQDAQYNSQTDPTPAQNDTPDEQTRATKGTPQEPSP